MKIRIIKAIPTGTYGFHVSFNIGQVIAVDEEIAKKLIDEGYAEVEV